MLGRVDSEHRRVQLVHLLPIFLFTSVTLPARLSVSQLLCLLGMAVPTASPLVFQPSVVPACLLLPDALLFCPLPLQTPAAFNFVPPLRLAGTEVLSVWSQSNTSLKLISVMI